MAREEIDDRSKPPGGITAEHEDVNVFTLFDEKLCEK